MSEEVFKNVTEVNEDEAGRMTLENAQEEANMIRALLTQDYREEDKDGNSEEEIVLGVPKDGVSLKESQVSYEGITPSSEDYEKALRSLEKLVNLTKTPNLSKKLQIALLQLVTGAFEYIMAYPNLIIGTPLKMMVTISGESKTLKEIKHDADTTLRRLKSLSHESSN